MARITSTEFQQNVGVYSDTALQEPVIITNHNRDRLVLIGVEEYKKLKSLEGEMTNERKAQMENIFDTHKETFEKLSLR